MKRRREMDGEICWRNLQERDLVKDRMGGSELD
jgi:hypothetical protein